MLTLYQTPDGPRYLPHHPTWSVLPDGGVGDLLPAHHHGPWVVISTRVITETMRHPTVVTALGHLYPEAVFCTFQEEGAGEYRLWAYPNPLLQESGGPPTEIYWTQTGDLLRPPSPVAEEDC